MAYLQLFMSILTLIHKLVQWVSETKSYQAKEWVIDLTDTIVCLKEAKTTDQRKQAAKMLQNLLTDL